MSAIFMNQIICISIENSMNCFPNGPVDSKPLLEQVPLPPLTNVHSFFHSSLLIHQIQSNVIFVLI